MPSSNFRIRPNFFSPIAFVLAVAAALPGCHGDDAAPPPSAATAGQVVGRLVALGPDGQHLPAGVAIYAAGKHETPRWEGMAGEQFGLPPGRYDILIEYFGQKYWRRGEPLAAGETTVKLPMATLSVETLSSAGERLSGEVAVFPVGATNGAAAMRGRSFEDMAVLGGDYDVRVAVQGRERWVRDVTLAAGDRVTRTLVEAVGYLRVEAVDQNGDAVAAKVWIYRPTSSHTPVAAGESGRAVALLPGRYDVAVRGAGGRDYSAGVAVLENQTTVERFNFWRGEER